MCESKQAMKVLIVDDEKINRAVLNKILQYKYEIFEADNGQSALDVMAEEKIDAVLLDIRMPVMDGYEFLKTVRKMEEYNGIPIIAVTAGDDQFIAETTVLDLGADDYIMKPVSPEVVKKRLSNIINLYHAIKKSNHDLMTNLLNRNTFMDEVEYKLQNAANGVKCAYFAIDLDDFKKINDNMGHLFGDKVLVEFSEILLDLKNKYLNLEAGRIGGDEFALFIYDYEDEQKLIEISEECQQKMKNGTTLNHQTKATCSIGIALFPKDAEDGSKLYYKADQALYDSKDRGKNRYTFYGVTSEIREGKKEEDKPWIIDEAGLYVYICDLMTDELYYANKNVLDLLEENIAGGVIDASKACVCHKLGLSDTPFTFCDSNVLRGSKAVSKIVKTQSGKQFFYKCCLIFWDGRLSRLTIVSRLEGD